MIRTERLKLRPWVETDIEPFAAMGRDPEVMEFFPSLQTHEQAAAGAARVMAGYARDGFCFWALEIPGVAPFIGFCGIKTVEIEVNFTPAVEIGWRLARDYWGQGFAIEAARASVVDGFGRCGLRELVAMVVPANLRSRAVMGRLGMTRDELADFDHPSIAKGSPIRRHYLYRLAAPSLLVNSTLEAI